MKRCALFLLAGLLFVPVVRAQDIVCIKTMFVETSSAVTVPLDDATLGRMKNARLLAAPTVYTKSGLKAAVESTPQAPANAEDASEPMPSSVTLEATATIQENGIGYHVRIATSEAVVAAVIQDGVTETVSHIIDATGTAKEGEPLWLRLRSSQPGRQTLARVTFTRQAPADVHR